MYKKSIVNFFLVSFLLLFSSSAVANNITFSTDEKEWLAAHKTVKIGIDYGYAPYSFVDDNGNVKGVVKDYLDILQKKLGIHFVVVSNLSWSQLMEAVKLHRIDAVATVIKTPERERFLAFSAPYIKTPYVLITREDTKQIHTTKDLLKLRVALVKGYASSKQMLQKHPHLQVLYVSNVLEGLQAVSNNKADAFMGALGVSQYLALRNGINNLKVNVKVDIKNSSQCFAVRKDWPELASLLTKALNTIPQKQKDDILEKYLGLQIRSLHMLNEKKNIFVYFPWLGGLFLFLGMIYILMILWNYLLKKELEKNRAYFEIIFQSAPNIMIITNGNKIFRMNKKMLDFAGDKNIESISELFIEKENYLYAQMGEQSWLEYILDRKDELHEVCMKKDGEERFFTIYAEENLYINDEKSIVVLNDITKLKELENTLRYSKRQFDLFMQNLPFTAVIKDENYNNLYINGKDISINLGQESGKKIDLLCNLAKENGKAEKIIIFNINNKEIFVRVVAFSIEQPNGKIYVGVLYIDITQEYLAQEKIKEQEEMMLVQSRHAAMGEMISMIAHQWRQPISVISMDANNIMADVELESVSDEALREYAKDIMQQTQYLSKTIEDFRNFFKPNKLKDTILVSDVFDEALSVIGKSLEYNNITIAKNFETSTKVKIYSRELLQVLLNILKNAKEALIQNRETGRQIRNSIFEDEKCIIVEICDNAGGIKDDIIEKIFDPYFSTKDEMNGTGLGLYMSKTIVDKHIQGILKVQNKDDGACFRIEIPKTDKKEENLND